VIIIGKTIWLIEEDEILYSKIDNIENDDDLKIH